MLSDWHRPSETLSSNYMALRKAANSSPSFITQSTGRPENKFKVYLFRGLLESSRTEAPFYGSAMRGSSTLTPDGPPSAEPSG